MRFLSGAPVLAVLADGKRQVRLLHQLPALIGDGLALVVAAHRAHARSGAADAQSRRSSATLNSSVDARETAQTWASMKSGELNAFTSFRPNGSRWTDCTRRHVARASAIAIDGSLRLEWGRDFRPEYRQIRTAVEALGNPQVIAFGGNETATRGPTSSTACSIRSEQYCPTAVSTAPISISASPPRSPRKQIGPFWRSARAKRHHLLPLVARPHREDCRMVERRGLPGRGLSRRHAGSGAPREEPGSLPAGRRHHHRRPSRSAWASTSPTCASSRMPTPQRSSGASYTRIMRAGATGFRPRRAAALWHRGHGAAPPPDRRKADWRRASQDREREVQPAGGMQSILMPAAGPARLFDGKRPPRQVRRLPGRDLAGSTTERSTPEEFSPPSIAPASASARPISPMS